MSLTRRELLVRVGAVAAWVGAGGAFVAERLGAFDEPPPFDRKAFPGARRRAAVAVLRAASYDGDLEGLLLEGLRLVERRRARPLRAPQAEPRRVLRAAPRSTPTRGSSSPQRTRCGASARRRSSSPKGPGHRRDTEAVVVASGLREALDDARLPFVDLNDAPLVRTPLRTRVHGPRASSGCRRSCATTEVVVSMPKLKTHHWVGVTLSLKNCFGCMPGRVYGWPKDVFHVRSDPASRSSTSPPRSGRRSRSSTASSACKGTARSWATRSTSGVVVVSRDLVAADVTGARLMGMDPEKVEYLMEAGRFLGQARSELIEQRGEDPGAAREALPAGAGLRPHPRA